MEREVSMSQMLHHVLDCSPDKTYKGEIHLKLSNNWLKMHNKPMRRHGSINGNLFALTTKTLSLGHPINKTIHSNFSIPWGS